MNINTVKDCKNICNSGGIVNFESNPHIPAVLLKNFLRDLEEPIMTYDLYEEITQFQSAYYAFAFIDELL